MIAAVCILLAFLCACSAEKLDYYSQRENYVRATGTITHIKYNDDHTGLYLAFSNLSREFDDTSFKIVGSNLQIAQSNGIDSKLELGGEVSFMTAPKYFGDGYVMPIVAISINGESLLDFEDGYDNWLEYLRGQ